MKLIKAVIPAILISLSTFAQGQTKWFTRTGEISIFSVTTAENIDAKNNEVFSLIDASNGDVAFQVLITGFKFKKSLMEEHFNENYMESTKFPKALFKGGISDISKVNFSSNGNYPVDVAGDLTIHGVTQKVKFPATIIIDGGKVKAMSKFVVRLADYNIKVPALVAKQISETIDISVNCNYDPYNK